ncbi:unnamed protein product [Diatraea saccharalis]|uniref:Uncharacterized protein n=1 Tax=Diatraea saccharalis TaxID=40085 RepID=A0A9N9R5I8_9NEOP|nr:unnamed protein product [Diatraea saccharalis]
MDISLEEKCENLMNIVVESRKRFGKMCREYEQKTSLIENRILNLQLETISSYRFKPKQTISHIEMDEASKDYEDEIVERSKRIEDLKKRLRSAQDVVLQLKSDNVARKLREPLNAEVLLSKAKIKHLS